MFSDSDNENGKLGLISGLRSCDITKRQSKLEVVLLADFGTFRKKTLTLIVHAVLLCEEIRILVSSGCTHEYQITGVNSKLEKNNLPLSYLYHMV